MNQYFVPTPLDEATRLEVDMTLTSSGNGTVFDLGTPTGAGTGVGAAVGAGGIGLPVAAVVKVSMADRSNSDETYTFKLQESPDGGTWTDIGPEVSVDVSGTTASERPYAVPGFLSQHLVRLVVTLTGTSPVILYDAWLTTQGFPKT